MSHRLTNERCFALTRQIEIDYPGVNNYSQFSYDGQGRNTKIVETVAGSVTSTKQFVWCGSNRHEGRDASGTVVAKFFQRGQTAAGSSYFYVGNHFASVTEMTDSGGTLSAQYKYDPFGRTVNIQSGGGASSDFQFAGYYVHQRTGSYLPLHRAYTPSLGRWFSRDLIQENGGVSLFTYVSNNPVSFSDPSGLAENPICLRGLAGCLEKCISNLHSDLGYGPTVFGETLAVEMALPIDKRSIGLAVAGGAAGKEVSTFTTMGGIIARLIPGNLPFLVETPTYLNPAAYVGTIRGLATRAAPWAGMGLGALGSGFASANYAECANKCNCDYEKCINSSIWD